MLVTVVEFGGGNSPGFRHGEEIQPQFLGLSQHFVTGLLGGIGVFCRPLRSTSVAKA